MSKFSTKQYEWSDITAAAGGRIIDGLTAVEYSKKKNKEQLMGRGNKSYGIQGGNFEYEGKLELWQSEVIAMEESAPDGELLDLEFDLTVAYASTGGSTTVKTLKGVQFTEQTEGMSQGDTHMKIELPIIFRDVVKQS